MTETIINIAKMLIAILPFVFLCFVSPKMNLSKPDRSKQFLMPIITLVYVVLAMLLMNYINEGLITFIHNIPEWMIDLAEVSWMPNKISEIILQVSAFIKKVILSLNLSFWVFFISNTIIIVAYLFIKKFCIKIISSAVKIDGELHTKIASKFYEYFPEKSKWCIKENYIQVRGMFKVFYYSSVVLSAILMIVSRNLYYNGLLRTVFYPVFGILVVGELYFYLGGITKREYTGHILGEDEDAYKTVNYSLLRKFMRSIFGDKLLSENTSVNNALANDVSTDDIIRELENSEDQKVVCFASYMNSLSKTGFQIDQNYLYSSLDLLNGKSILFNNPFYNDLVPYAFYPMNRTLLTHQKVLVVLGRHYIEEDIKKWLEKGIETITGIPFFWKIGLLTKEEQDIDIGIVTRSDVLDIELHNANSDFLENVGFFVIIEPSKLISTAQIGLNLIVKKCRADDDKNIVFCMCDKNCDGLVDAMSHVLMANITEVTATNKHLGTSSYMCWSADDEYLHHRLVPNISRYLGMGTELSFAALKNQVSKTKWYGGDAFPVLDLRWISKQYYYDLTKYAGLSTSQEAMDEHFITTPNFWSAEVEKHTYVTVEDESNNMFEVLRDFSTRATEQGFINVISSEYLLKDYMADNASIFEADAKAIPFIVADYARSNRNTVLRLILMMSTFPVCSEILEKEFSLLGIAVYDLKRQLWYEIYKCYSSISEIETLPDDYKEAVDFVYGKSLKIDDAEWTNEIICFEDSYNLKRGKMETIYSIVNSNFLDLCVAELCSAGYVAEDEKGQQYYLGAELYGHIYQKYLPGQFLTFGGKYYEMQYLTADGQILVRRAADHITGRPAYRQIREYIIEGVKPSEKIGSQKNIAGMKVIKEFADICVKTYGYYKMEKYNDFKTAKKILFEGEKTGIPKRVYRSKEILRIELPEMAGKLSDNVRYTVTVLFNEIFRTIFAENQDYICAVTDDSFITDSLEDKPFTYTIKGDGCEIKNNAIYIIEDSQLDLGLTVAVERNLERIFGIIHDYIDWHLMSLEESIIPPVEEHPNIVFENPESKEKPKKNIFRRIIDKIKGWFKRKPKEDDSAVEEEPENDIPTQTPEEPITPESPEIPESTELPENSEEIDSSEKIENPEEGESVAPETQEEKKGIKGIFGWFKRRKKAKKKEVMEETELNPELDFNPEIESEVENNTETKVEDEAEVDFEFMDETEKEDEQSDDDASTDGLGSAEETPETREAPFESEGILPEGNNKSKEDTVFSNERKPYNERYYLLYGGDSEPACIDLFATLKYLSEMGLQRNALKQARDGKKIAEFVEATYKPGKPDARYCDFCGAEIYGVEYETLVDGRDRCLNCSRTAIKTGEEFQKIFEDVKRNLESFFGIQINAGIKVEMVNSKKLHKRLGHAFLPTPNSDGRILGVAISDKDGFSLYVENGSPRMASMLTMAHELTHIWQYIHWNDKAIRKKYGKKMHLEIYEGMAKWVEIQYAYLINEPARAKIEELITASRDDEYGRGFLRYRANYPFSLGTVITKATPFMNIETPLDPEFCGSFTVVIPNDGTNPKDGTGEELPEPKKTPVVPENPIGGPVERKPDALKRYAYGLLNKNEQAVYNRVLEAINNFENELTDLNGDVTDTQFKKIIDFIQRDYPEIFWLRHGTTYFFDTNTHIVNKLNFEYCLTREETKLRQEKIDAATKSFLDSVTNSMSDYEVTLRIYENIIKLVDYDTIGLEKQNNAPIAANLPDDLRSIYGVFVNKKAVCAGYAKALQYLLNLCGIECVYVTSATHAWNLVKLEGGYYHMDVTWGDGSDTKKDKPQSDSINYDCFCITTEEITRLKDHTPEDILPLPSCTETKCNYHRRHGLFFEEYDFERIKYIVCESAKANKLDISFKFASTKGYKEAKKQLVDNSKFREAIQYASLKSNTKINSSYSYSVRDDRLVLGFFIKKL